MSKRRLHNVPGVPGLSWYDTSKGRRYFFRLMVKGRKSSGTLPLGTTVEQAKRILEDRRAELQLGIGPRRVPRPKLQGGRMTVRDVAEVYRDTLTGKRSFRKMSRQINALVDGNIHGRNPGTFPGLGDCSLETLGRNEIIGMIDELENDGRSKGTVWKYLWTLRSICRLAIEDKIIATDPTKDKRVVERFNELNGDAKQHQALAAEEVARLLESAREVEGEWFADLIDFTVTTAARRSEVFLLKWSEVWEDDKIIEIPGERRKNKEPWVVRISPAIQEIIDRRREANPDGEYVFGLADGSPLILESGNLWDYRGALRRCLEHAGLDPESNPGSKRLQRITWHSFRATAATIAADAGVPWRTLMQIGGWKSPEMALRYTRESREAAAAGRDKLEAALQKAKRGANL